MQPRNEMINDDQFVKFVCNYKVHMSTYVNCNIEERQE